MLHDMKFRPEVIEAQLAHKETEQDEGELQPRHVSGGAAPDDAGVRGHLGRTLRGCQGESDPESRMKRG